MTEIFPSLIESTCIDSRVLANLPPVGKSIYDKNGNNIGLDTTNIKREREIYEREELRIKNDTSKIIFAFDSKIKRNRNNVEEDFEKHFSGAKIFESKKEQNLEYDFDFKELKIKNKFVLENISEFPKGKGEIWKAKYNFIFSGVVFFTRIQFDKDKKFGILDGGFACGRLCGQGSRIYIKKINNKWVIDKIEGTWVS
ncbi:MAG TPA: hypothetical protein PLO52_13975 [Flavobacterium alvei]|nr:hypothetical protein [Flavobacterium alvei]HQK41207.1 hypothetical protein [Flavobacterium alvei]